MDAEIGLPFLRAPVALVKDLALHCWRKFRTAELRDRKGFEDLGGREADLSTAADQGLDHGLKELLCVVRDGSFFDGFHLSKFDPKVLARCVVCGEVDAAVLFLI